MLAGIIRPRRDRVGHDWMRSIEVEKHDTLKSWYIDLIDLWYSEIGIIHEIPYGNTNKVEEV